jgi:hypothetical protein
MSAKVDGAVADSSGILARDPRHILTAPSIIEGFADFNSTQVKFEGLPTMPSSNPQRPLNPFVEDVDDEANANPQSKNSDAQRKLFSWSEVGG